MRVLVCGGRDYVDTARIFAVLDLIGPSHVIHGAARGADNRAGLWAHERGVGCETYPANWTLYGPKAGWIRNTAMLRQGYPDMVLAFPGGRGTANMVKIARAAGVPTIEVPDAP